MEKEENKNIHPPMTANLHSTILVHGSIIVYRLISNMA
jgi:hypothetical protein